MTSSSHPVPMKISVTREANFWWASQSENFRDVFPDGTLWAPLRGSIGQRNAFWDTLLDVRPGDIVLHYVRPAIRGISRAATLPVLAYPPARGYKEPADTEGRLVLTDPVREVHIPWDDIRDILPPGKRPLTIKGTPMRGYFFDVSREGALQLLQKAGLEITDGPCEGPPEAASADQHLGGPSDKWTLGAIRTEQRFLRNQQLLLRGSSCSICGHSFPEQLLVAAHIKPRKDCSEKERMDTRNVSMLACLFGCDALFELGYIVVDESGLIQACKPASKQVSARIEGLAGRKCRAHDERSRGYFAWHRQAHSGKVDQAGANTPDLRWHPRSP
ncbi:HNH endonuclease [Arthrobacter alkaliphilus]|uniref:HNH endonuclease signature motif containing protein n=1 Tax=Arthrobacter alkaliphilus TaxID=369936 RepID=UPI001F3E25CE|nr:HNH endonuclease signature motif containing protein [Arthrobacter alkaliphilus]